MGAPAVGILMVLGVMMVMGRREVVAEGATWCIARSGASETALQTALDYACGAGADCLPIQASGLCYLPNTLPAHASYAFNSYYQRSNAAPGSCDFAGSATVTVTDPSYGSCTYPSSKRSASLQPSSYCCHPFDGLRSISPVIPCTAVSKVCMLLYLYTSLLLVESTCFTPLKRARPEPGRDCLSEMKATVINTWDPIGIVVML
ncbi:hypothetical protein COCNU_scaffold008759G000050 [Cocos nucifera]|nr:hypothetical protein [Cocos nucifera]